MAKKSQKEEMYEIYKSDVQFNDDDLQHIHMGYWYPDSDPNDLSKAQKNYLHEATNRMNIQPGNYVLDIGCGNGGPAIWLHKQYQCRVCGIDIIPRHAETARAVIEKNNLQDMVDAQCMDACDMSWPAETFDHVMSLECIYHIDKREELFDQVHRILKPNGWFFMSEYVLYPPCSGLSAQIAAIFSGSKYLWHISRYPEMLKKHGFEVVAVENVTTKTVLPAIGWSQNEKHRHLREILYKNYGKLGGFFTSYLIVPIFYRLLTYAVKRGHLGQNFIWARKA